MNLDVLKSDGSGKATEIEVSDAVFDRPFNEGLVHQVVTAYRAAGRQGSRTQKNRSAVSGGGKKPWRQKGTGRARAGTTRGPIWRGGGVTFPSGGENFNQKVNRKMFRGAMCSIVSELGRGGRLTVVDELAVQAPKTRELAGKLDKLDARNALLVIGDADVNLELAARNIPNIGLAQASKVDPVSLLGFERVLISADGVRKLEERLA